MFKVTIAEEAIVIVEKITKLKEKDFTKIQALGKRASGSAVAVLPQLYAHPIVNMKLIREWTGFSVSGAQAVIDRFIDIGILIPKDRDK